VNIKYFDVRNHVSMPSNLYTCILIQQEKSMLVHMSYCAMDGPSKDIALTCGTSFKFHALYNIIKTPI
jgi:hypothetical protein